MVSLSLLSLLMALTFSTINVRSVKTKNTLGSHLSFLNTITSDVILIQECAIPFSKACTQWQDMWPQPSIWSGSNGVAILIQNPLVLVKGSTVVREGRALLVNLTFMGKDFNLLNIYGFNDKHERYDLLEELQPHMLGRVSLVVGGDFNCVLSRKDRK